MSNNRSTARFPAPIKTILLTIHKASRPISLSHHNATLSTNTIQIPLTSFIPLINNPPYQNDNSSQYSSIYSTLILSTSLATSQTSLPNLPSNISSTTNINVHSMITFFKVDTYKPKVYNVVANLIMIEPILVKQALSNVFWRDSMQ